MMFYDYPSFQFKADTELVCRHLIQLRNLPTSQSIQSFRCLFMEGVGYPDRAVLQALNQIVESVWAESEFTHFLNRCCYILINHWWSKPGFERATVDLVNLFEHLPPVVFSPWIDTQKLRSLVQQFIQTPQYETLQRYAQVAENDFQATRKTRDSQSDQGENSKQMDELIYRYPFLYPYFLLSNNSGELGQRAVRRKQAEMQQQFEDCLWNYVSHLLGSTTTTSPLQNPTLLKDASLKVAIAHFTGDVEKKCNYQQLSQQFLGQASRVSSFKALKQELFTYLTNTIRHSSRPSYGDHAFNDWLQAQLKQILPESDNAPPNGLLLVQTCDQLLEALIVGSNQSNKHSMFLDLQGNLGSTLAIGFLLKIVLVCCQVKSNMTFIRKQLAERFSNLLRHYATSLKKDVEWLTECLDNWMIAQTIHFGRYEFSQWSNLL